MEDEYDWHRVEDQSNRYMKTLVQCGAFFIFAALCLNIGAALESHIALWQVLVWLGTISFLLSVISFLAYFWLDTK